MLDLLTTEEFARWFKRLGDDHAEEVATALEMVQQLGPERSPPNSRDMLLWYQSLPETQLELQSRYGDAFFELAQHIRTIVVHLESAAVQRRLTELPIERAERSSAAIAAIMSQVRKLRILGMIEQPTQRPLEDVERQYHSILDSIGLCEPPPAPLSDTLRELNVRSCTPHIRVLYGVDIKRNCALLVLGESLERMAYGPSVRRALALWREFLAGSAEAARVQSFRGSE